MISKPRVLLLGKLPPPYFGPAIATKILLDSDLNTHYDIQHVNTKLNQNIEEFGKKGLKKFFLNFKVYWNYYQSIKSFDPEIILIPISQTSMGFYKDSIFILLTNCKKRKVLVQLRGSNLKNWLASASKFTNLYVAYIFRKCHSAIVLGEKLSYLFAPFFSDQRIHVLPNGSNYPLARKQPSNRGAVIKLLYFANFLESKGFDLIIDALKNLNHPFELNAVGKWFDPAFKKACINKIQSLGLTSKIVLNDAASGKEKWDYFNKSDVFLFTPREPEGHPWVIVEAMAAGLPIISTDQGAITESVIDQKNGFIVPSSDSSTILDKIEVLADNEELRMKMAQKSRELYLTNFTEEALVNNYNKVFKKILN